MGFHHGFDLGEYNTVYDIPKERAYRFFQQFRLMLNDRRIVRELYDDSYKHRGAVFRDLEDDADEELLRQDYVDANDSKGDEWVARIIQQRQAMRKYENQKAWEVAEAEAERQRQIAEKKNDDCEWAMEQTRIREAEQEKERVMTLYRKGKLRVELAKQNKKQKRIDEVNARLKAEMKAQRAAEKLKKAAK